MKPRDYWARLGFDSPTLWRCGLACTAMAGLASGASAAQISANAQLQGATLGHGNYAYTLTLNNSAASTASVKMFWFGWEAGQANFLVSQPTSIQTPAGWKATVLGGGAGDGYSIQFVTFTNQLNPGSSATFTFESPDPPSFMASPAAFYPESPTSTSEVYSNPAASGVQDVFVAQVVSTDLGALATRISGSKLVLSWAARTNVVLQQSSALNPPHWTTVSGTLGSGTFSVTNAANIGAAFFRLATP